MRAVGQGPISNHRFKIDNIPFGYSVRFDVRRERININVFHGNVILLLRLDLKMSGTPRWLSATDWKVIIFATASMEKMCQMKSDSIVQKVWLGRLHVETEPGFRDLWRHFMLHCQGKDPSKSRWKYLEKPSVTLVQNEYICEWWLLLLNVLFFVFLKKTKQKKKQGLFWIIKLRKVADLTNV